MALNKIINDFIESKDFDLSSNGYIKLESGLILQWGGTGTIASSASSVITLPIAFPNAGLRAVSQDTTSTANIYMQGLTATTITLVNDGPGAGGAQWFALGY